MGKEGKSKSKGKGKGKGKGNKTTKQDHAQRSTRDSGSAGSSNELVSWRDEYLLLDQTITDTLHAHSRIVDLHPPVLVPIGHSARVGCRTCLGDTFFAWCASPKEEWLYPCATVQTILALHQGDSEEEKAHPLETGVWT